MNPSVRKKEQIIHSITTKANNNVFPNKDMEFQKESCFS